MKKKYIILLIIFVFAFVDASSATASHRRRRRRHEQERKEQERKEQEHRLQHHNGKIASYEDSVEHKTTKLTTKEYVYWTYQYYYYVDDPDRCIIETKEVLKRVEPMSDEEYKKEILIVKIFLVSLILLTILLAILFAYYFATELRKIKKKL